jgi:hypothetical protein
VTDDLSKLSLADADRRAREQIEFHRDEMGQWRRARAVRLAFERDAGRSVVEIAAEIGVTVQVVYDLLREARKATE